MALGKFGEFGKWLRIRQIFPLVKVPRPISALGVQFQVAMSILRTLTDNTDSKTCIVLSLSSAHFVVKIKIQGILSPSCGKSEE